MKLDDANTKGGFFKGKFRRERQQNKLIISNT
jgi:hypothetical protein